MASKSRLTGDLVSKGNITPIVSTNRIGIGSTAPQYSLDVIGDINYSGTLRSGGVPVSIGSGSGLPLSGGSMSGIITFSSNQTLNNLSFTQVGTGASIRTLDDKLNDLPSVLDFIPASEHAGIRSGISTYDCTTAFQAAIDAHRCVYVPYGAYRVSSTINLNQSYSGLIGDLRMPWIIRTDPTSSPAIKITATGSNLNELSRIENIILWHGIPGDPVNTTGNPRPSYPITPTVSTSSGIAIDGTGSTANPAVQRTRVSNVRIVGWGVGVYLGPSVNTKLERIIVENHTVWSSYNTSLNSSNKYVGYYFNATPVVVGGISPMASIEVDGCIVNGNFCPNVVNSFGFLATGTDLRDIFFTNCETAGGNYGFFIEGSGNNYNWDIHIIRPIIDAYKTHGLVLKNLAGPAGVSVIGGYAVRDPAGSGTAGLSGAILLENCDGCSITGGFQIYGYSSDDAYDDGIRLYNTRGTTIADAIIKNCRYGISLDNSPLNTIVGNQIYGVSFTYPPSSNTTPVLSNAIRLFNTSNGNLISNNIVRGVDGTTKYSLGLYVESASTGNNIINNSVESATVTTPYSVSTGNAHQMYTSMQVNGDITLTQVPAEFEFNTGGPRLRLDTANTLRFHTGGGIGTTSEEIMRFNPTGLGVGTTVINTRLNVSGISSFTGDISLQGRMFINTAPAEIQFTSSGPRFMVDTANTLKVHTGGGFGSSSDEIMRLNPAGVGIGTTTYRQKLDVEGAVLATGGFISAGSTTPAKITVSGNQLVFTVPGIGAATLTLT